MVIKLLFESVFTIFGADNNRRANDNDIDRSVGMFCAQRIDSICNKLSETWPEQSAAKEVDF